MTEQQINELIKQEGIDTNLISDGYHTFGELYEHRNRIFIQLCAIHDTLASEYGEPDYVAWKTKVHSDGSVWEGSFLLGIGKEKGKQITYHLPMSYWNELFWAKELDKAPEWDGHTSVDVLERLKAL